MPPQPRFDRAPRADRAAGPLFGGAPASKAKTAAKFKRSSARAFARIRRAEQFLEGELFPKKEGDQVHMILDAKRLNPGDMLLALCRHLNRGVRHLRISTLTLSGERNLLQLTELIDSGTVKKLSLLVSEVFVAYTPETWSKVGAALRQRKCDLAASRTHAKICCLDCEGGSAFVFYGSGNLRTAKSQEQLTLCRDRGVHDFYAAWIDEQMAQHAYTGEEETEVKAES